MPPPNPIPLVGRAQHENVLGSTSSQAATLAQQACDQRSARVRPHVKQLLDRTFMRIHHNITLDSEHAHVLQAAMLHKDGRGEGLKPWVERFDKSQWDALYTLLAACEVYKS